MYGYLGRIEQRTEARRIDRLFAKRPSGERVRVAVHNADSEATDRGDQIHRQGGESLTQVPMALRGSRQQAHHGVRAGHIGIAHVVRIAAAAAAAGCRIAGQQLGFDVAANRPVAQYFSIDACERGVVNIEPVEVAIEHPLCVWFDCAKGQQGIERKWVAVKAADHVERLCREICSAVERGRAIAI